MPAALLARLVTPERDSGRSSPAWLRARAGIRGSLYAMTLARGNGAPCLRCQWHACNVLAMTQTNATKPTRTIEMKGHSIVLHVLFGMFVLWIPTVYYALSPRHYFHV